MKTWYQEILDQPAAVMQLNDTACDVCVVGAGLAGLSTALELAKYGKRVIVLEANSIAWGASGRNGGFVSPGFAQSHKYIASRVGNAEANTLYAMSIEGMHAVMENIRTHDMGDALPVHGILSACRYPASTALRSRQQWLEKHFDYEVQYLDQQDIAEHLSSNCYCDALHDQQAFHFNPLAYARALAHAAQSLGVQIAEHSMVKSMSRHNDLWQLSTGTTTIHARDVVLCTGGYTGNLASQLYRTYLPIATYVMVTKADRQRVSTALRTRSAILDDRRASDYYRVVDQGRRLLWGGCITTRTTEPAQLGKVLHARMAATFPQLKDLAVDYAWSGLMSYARHQMPQIGRMDVGLWHCTAFGGHGMNTTAIGGRVIAEAISAQSDRYLHFKPFGLVSTGGVLGKVAVQATYWRYQFMDRWQERSRSVD